MLSTTIAFSPPVSAISGVPGRRFAAIVAAIVRAVSVDPVNTTPAMRGSEVMAVPTTPPRPGSSCSALAGTPALCSSRTASAAMAGVASAGFASTAFPAISAAAIWPVKIASGKFHGLIAPTMPRGAAVTCSPSAA